MIEAVEPTKIQSMSVFVVETTPIKPELTKVFCVVSGDHILLQKYVVQATRHAATVSDLLSIYLTCEWLSCNEILPLGMVEALKREHCDVVLVPDILTTEENIKDTPIGERITQMLEYDPADTTSLFHTIHGLLRLSVGSTGSSEQKHLDKVTKAAKAFASTSGMTQNSVNQVVPSIFPMALHHAFTEKISGMRLVRKWLFAVISSVFESDNDTSSPEAKITAVVMQRLERSQMTSTYLILNFLIAPQHPIIHSSALATELRSFVQAIRPLIALKGKAAFASFNLSEDFMRALRINNFPMLQTIAVTIARMKVPTMAFYATSEESTAQGMINYATLYQTHLDNVPAAGSMVVSTDDNSLSIKIHEHVRAQMIAAGASDQQADGISASSSGGGSVATGLSYNPPLMI